MLQEWCLPAGTECYEKIPTNSSCPHSCLGLYADINDFPTDKDMRQYIELMQREYLAHKASFGQTVPFDNIDSKFKALNMNDHIIPGWTPKQEDLMLVQVYPDTTSFDRIDRDTKNTLETQISLIGGTMGLFTGKVNPINMSLQKNVQASPFSVG